MAARRFHRGLGGIGRWLAAFQGDGAMLPSESTRGVAEKAGGVGKLLGLLGPSILRRFCDSISSRLPQMRRLLTCAALLLASGSLAQSVEYLPPITWQEPPVVTPGATDDAPPSDAIVLFDGTDLSAWKGADNWRVQDGAMIAGEGYVRSKQEFGDCQVHVEWSAPTPAKGLGQGRGNSGVFLMGEYEVQVLDSYQNKTYPEGQAASIYKQTPPMANATRPPGEWNKYDLFWTVPRFDGTKIVPATVTVVHNGVLVQNHHVLTGDTAWHKPSSYGDLPATGPIALQDHGNPVRFRNIWVRELSPAVGKPRPAKYKRGGKTWPAELGPDGPDGEE